MSSFICIIADMKYLLLTCSRVLASGQHSQVYKYQHTGITGSYDTRLGHTGREYQRNRKMIENQRKRNCRKRRRQREKFEDFHLQNDEFDPYAIVILNQL